MKVVIRSITQATQYTKPGERTDIDGQRQVEFRVEGSDTDMSVKLPAEEADQLRVGGIYDMVFAVRAQR